MATVGNGAFTVVYLVGGFAAGYAGMNVSGHGSALVAATLALLSAHGFARCD